MNILIAYGTRPEFLKIKPLIDKMKDVISFKTVFTGQHKDIIDKNYLPDYKLNIIDNSNRLDSVLSSCLNNDDIFKNITHVLIQGDTTSALGIAMSAFNTKIKVIHLEAGLRTYDLENPYPEEGNRQMISRITDIHLCPTKNNKINLEEECVNGDIYVVGNTGLDNLVEYKPKIIYENKILITLHRRENHDIIDKWFEELNHLAENNKDIEFILPLHPNPNVQKFKYILTHVNVIEPLDHKELLNILVKCKFIISDSGGLQEEASFLNKKIIVCRKVTERPESLGLTSFYCKKYNDLKNIFNDVNTNYIVDVSSPFGDGYSSEKIIKILKNYE